MTDRAKLEEALHYMRGSHGVISGAHSREGGDYGKCLRALVALTDAAEAHLATLPKTKKAEVSFVIRVSPDASQVFYCQPDTPENRQEVGQRILRYGGQMVTVKGVAEVPA